MMKMTSLFCMNGCGYLQSITQQSEEFKAIFMMLNDESGELKQDCVQLEVVVPDNPQQRLLSSLLVNVENGHSVIVQFSSEYLMLVNTASGMTSEDPRTIVTLKVKLSQIEKCFIDGMPLLKPRAYAFA